MHEKGGRTETHKKGEAEKHTRGTEKRTRGRRIAQGGWKYAKRGGGEMHDWRTEKFMMGGRRN